MALGYPLGKAQHLQLLLADVEPAYVHQGIMPYSEAYALSGLDVPRRMSYGEAKGAGALEKRPWILYAPAQSGRSLFLQYLKRRFGAVLMIFSGWAVEDGYRYAMAVDEAYPLSDHSDFQGLLSLVERVQPERVYTAHGFAEQFAHSLRARGFEAQPLTRPRATMAKYLRYD